PRVTADGAPPESLGGVVGVVGVTVAGVGSISIYLWMYLSNTFLKFVNEDCFSSTKMLITLIIASYLFLSLTLEKC
ncbi:MAG: hypothetical protein ACK52I_35980, partial [Pseudomonadota bacterium]